MLEIRSNGSKWYGQELDTIEDLMKVLSEYPLDATFEKYGNFVTEFKPAKGWRPENEKYKGCTSFFGNFHTYSHVFSIITDELELIDRLTAAIRENQQTEAYKQARIEVEERERQIEEEREKRMERLTENQRMRMQFTV
ncbi:hypothetical protein [Paenibacillus cremeus]|uniref:Uncharacterized protein n=1 Tax=Paenibacillus cremeus TaxID=2163881 RepID=A0A559KCT0_9BACL|nr:hypothetical protein [Paenibacillus cremeus]TVY09924.1 hypothetical protein FPZ49_11170 [Paenibacillus cremeus]